jgi:hypothetical protein
VTEAGGNTAERLPIPYLPFDTFKNFVDALSGGRPLPPRIDRSLMSGMAGGTQTLLLGSLSTFGLIGDNREVLPPFVELVRADEEGRRRVMAGLLKDLYPEAVKLAEEHATADQLAESFRVISGYQGSTLRKAITFFLNMAKYAQVDLSPFFRAPAQNTGGRKPAARRGRPVAPVATAVAAGPTSATAAAMESRSIELVSGGTVVISCSVSFLSLSRGDRDFVFDLVDKLDGYRQSHPDACGAAASTAATSSGTETR